MSSTEFELEGRKFEIKRLSPDDACMGLEVLGKAMGPAMATVLLSGDGTEEGKLAPIDYGEILQALLLRASQIGVLLQLFAPRSRFDRSKNGFMVELKPFLDEVFGGRVDLVIAFLVHAVRAEYSCFLGGSNALGQLMGQLGGSKSESPKAPTA